ncbi:hypothetical protein AC1031_009963 [Aphanomyces cochlioides]|nr:hypothetical protein AC1031_009963 [Aphanomyces cochlioides]
MTVTTKDAEAFMNAKAQPAGALGHLQKVAVQLCVLQQTYSPAVESPVCLVFCGDHGITKADPAAGPSAYPREVTELMYQTVVQGRAAVAVLCATHQVTCACTDVGIDSDRESQTRLARGTNDMTTGPAMSIDLCKEAIQLGRDIAKRYILEKGKDAVCIGELGIGNTTAASALVAAFTGAPARDVCGRGTGLDDAGVERKIRVVEAALATNAAALKAGPLETLAAVGGLEIAAMAGAMLEAASRRVPVVVDGFISGAAALCARRLEPEMPSEAFFFSHQSEEKGAVILLQALNGVAPLQMNMRLGEGTGAVLCMPLLKSAAAILRDMTTLEAVIRGEMTPNDKITVE